MPTSSPPTSAIPAAVEPLLEGAEALYLIWPNFDPGETAGATALLAAARRAGVPGRLPLGAPPAGPVDAAPRGQGPRRGGAGRQRVAWRVLQPCAYADNLDGQLAEAPVTGILRSPWGLGQAQSLVDLVDVADAAAVLLTEDGLDGGTFEAVGPEPLTAPRIAQLMAERLGRDGAAVDAVPDGPVLLRES